MDVDSVNLERMKKVYGGSRVLITGHTGFKGSWLSFILNSLGARVYGASNSTPDDSRHIYHALGVEKFITNRHHNLIDVTTADYNKLLREIEPHFIFHLAAQAIVSKSYSEPENTIHTNVIGVLNLLEYLRQTERKTIAIIVTSDKCYKNNNLGIPFKETDELGGKDPYSASKAAAEIVINSYLESFPNLSRNHGLASCRAGNVFGGGDFSENRLVPDLIRSLLSSQSPQIRMPSATRPWTYVLDVLNGYISLAIGLQRDTDGYSESWNFASEGQMTVQEIAETLIGHLGEGSVIIDDSATFGYEAKYLGLDPSKARLRLNWRPKLNTSEALKDTIDWYRAAQTGTDMEAYTTSYLLEYLSK